MRKVGLVFIVAIIVPSLVLAWLAVRSLSDQRFAIERQQSLLCQGVADSLAESIGDRLADLQADFSDTVETMLAQQSPNALAPGFDQLIREQWNRAEVGFAVQLPGALLCPSPEDSPAAQFFCINNGDFLGNREVAQVYGNVSYNQIQSAGKNVFQNWNTKPNDPDQIDQASFSPDVATQQQPPSPSVVKMGQRQSRKVAPVNPAQQLASPQQQQSLLDNNVSRLIPAEAEFSQLIGNATDGMLARFLRNKLEVMFWHRATANPNLVFGAQLDLARITEDLKTLVQVDSLLEQDICAALLNDRALPVALSRPDFQAEWKRPFVAAEISEALPHWEVGIYLTNPDSLAQAARVSTITLGLLITLLVITIGGGGWLIVADVNRQLRLTRQKTDFVSNVSHELKTPLTSIRMFSELLAEGTVTEPNKQRSYLKIIASESARLTRLINNVLDFARMDRGEKKYEFRAADLGELVNETVATYRPHLQSQGFTLEMSPIEAPLSVKCDRDALSQVMTNLLSNAEKYSNGSKQIILEVEARDQPVRHAEVRVLDRGPGVPPGCEERIFGQFYRADDSLSSGIQGSGLGLTLARQIARAHGGDVTYKPRENGGSCFTLILPVASTTDQHQ